MRQVVKVACGMVHSAVLTRSGWSQTYIHAVFLYFHSSPVIPRVSRPLLDLNRVASLGCRTIADLWMGGARSAGASGDREPGEHLSLLLYACVPSRLSLLLGNRIEINSFVWLFRGASHHVQHHPLPSHAHGCVCIPADVRSHVSKPRADVGRGRRNCVERAYPQQ